MTFARPHERNDWIALEMARRIAAEIQSNPALITQALTWISGLRSRGSDFASHREWEEILLSHPREDIVKLLTMENEEGQRLRSSHPFKGVVPPSERQAIIESAFAS